MLDDLQHGHDSNLNDVSYNLCKVAGVHDLNTRHCTWLLLV